MMKIIRFITTPPYRGLPWVLVGYVILSVLIVGQGGVFDGHLLGYDDHVRMVQVLNWVNGASWYDRMIIRANPPEGFTSIWSRIVDIPLAAVIIIAQNFMAQKQAALVAVAIVPVVQLGLLFKAAPYFVRPLVGRRKARLICLFLIFTSILNVKYFSASGFLIGQASHHPWYIILTLVMFGAVARLAIGSAARAPMMTLAASIALLTAVGIEGLPLIAGAVAVLGLVGWIGARPVVTQRGAGALAGAAFGSLVLLPLHQRPATLLSISFAEPSILAVILLAVAALFLAGETAILKRLCRTGFIIPMLATGLWAGLLAVGLVLAFPEILTGGAAGLSPQERQLALTLHFEAKPVHEVASDIWHYLWLITPTALAIIAGLYATATAPTRRRRALYLSYLGFAALGGGMCEIYARYYHHAMTTACAWLLWLWEKGKERVRFRRYRAVATAALFFILGPLPMLILPAWGRPVPFVNQILLFPALAQSAGENCDSLPLADYIDGHYAPDTLLLVPADFSQKLLYQSDVRLDFVANYPSHNKFIDNYAFFQSGDDEPAYMIARRHNVDLVATCNVPYGYDQTIPPGMQRLGVRLALGNPPVWLKRVEAKGLGDFMLYEVAKDR